MTKDDLKSRLQSVLGTTGVLTDDALAAIDPVIEPDNTNALLAVAPQNEAEIAQVFGVCVETNTPLIPQGGRTGLAGATSGTGVEILLLGTKMPRKIEIDPKSRTVLVSANTTLADLETATRKHGLTVGIDIAARDTATIGGMISTNAGGMEAFRNGTMRERVLGLQAVMPDGTLLDDLAHVRKCNEGYDVKQLLIGAEGTLGIITCATLQLLPAPPDPGTFLLSLQSASAALDVLFALQSNREIQVLRAEVLWERFATENAKLQSANPIANMQSAPLFVIYEIHSATDPEDRFFETIKPMLDSGSVVDAIAAQSGQQAADIWALREDTLSMQSVFLHRVWFDFSVPLSHLDETVAKIQTRLDDLDAGLHVHALGHLADGNLHYSVISPTPISDDLALKIKSAVLDGLKEIGGSFSAEHGIGTEKRWALDHYGDPGKRAVMNSIKTTFDPHNICNPGKVL